MKLFRLHLMIIVAMALWFAPASFAIDLSTVQTNKVIGQVVSRYATTDGSIALRVKWVGTTTEGLADVEVDAAGDIFFTADDGTADTSVSTDGTIDVSGTSENTMGEVVAAINASDNWQATLVDVIPSTSCNNVLTSTSLGTQDQSLSLGKAGKPLYYNTADLDLVSLSIGPEYTSDDELTVTNDSLLNRRSTPTGTGKSGAWVNELLYVTTNATYTSGAPDIKIYAVKNDAAGATEILLWQQVGAATTVAATIPVLPKQAPIRAPSGYRLVIYYLDTSTPDVTAGSMQVHGLSYKR